VTNPSRQSILIVLPDWWAAALPVGLAAHQLQGDESLTSQDPSGRRLFERRMGNVTSPFAVHIFWEVTRWFRWQPKSDDWLFSVLLFYSAYSESRLTSSINQNSAMLARLAGGQYVADKNGYPAFQDKAWGRLTGPARTTSKFGGSFTNSWHVLASDWTDWHVALSCASLLFCGSRLNKTMTIVCSVLCSPHLQLLAVSSPR
jgi:hypothetical protein